MSDESSFQAAMNAPIRGCTHNCEQGRRCTCYHVETATVAKVKCSIPCYPTDDAPKMLVNKWFYIAGAVCVAFWGAVAWWLK